jgi:hypothetical protein
MAISEEDLLPSAVDLIQAGNARGVPLRLVGGLAVRYLTPDFPPRTRTQQDLDFATSSDYKKKLIDYLEERGFFGDKRFNSLHGHKQMYFETAEGRALDVMVDKLEMCHVLDFKNRLDRMTVTLDVADLLLTKLQIVELNQKDAQDIIYLMSAYPVAEGDEPGTVSTGRITSMVTEDWGWWRTVTMNLDKVRDLATGAAASLVPSGAPHDAVHQIGQVRAAIDDAPKSLKWKLRAKIGDRKQWYLEPEEVEHD